MAINQAISQFPSAPNSATDTPQEFNGKANAFVAHQADTYVIEVNQWATEANELKDEVNALEQATQTAKDTAVSAKGDAEGSATLAGQKANDATVSANNSLLKSYEAEASKKTANSYALEPIGQDVIKYTSNGDGTYLATPQVGERSALHYAEASDKVSRTGDSMTGDLEMGSNSVNGINQCTAWVNANCSDNTIRASYNIASIEKMSEGRHKFTFTVPMDNINYIVNATPRGNSGTGNYFTYGAREGLVEKSVDSFQLLTRDASSNPPSTTNPFELSVLVHGGKN